MYEIWTHWLCSDCSCSVLLSARCSLASSLLICIGGNWSDVFPDCFQDRTIPVTRVMSADSFSVKRAKLMRTAANCPDCHKLESEYARSVANIKAVVHGDFETIGERIYALHRTGDIRDNVTSRMNTHRRRHFEKIVTLDSLSDRNKAPKKTPAFTSTVEHSASMSRLGNSALRNSVPSQKLGHLVPVHYGQSVEPVDARDHASRFKLVKSTGGQHESGILKAF